MRNLIVPSALLFISASATLSVPIMAQQSGAHSVVRATVIRGSPTGSDLVGQLEPGAPVQVIGRERGWVRVLTDGWVRESDVIAADSSISTTLSAADIRAAPAAARGALVRWTVQALALQTADPLRQGLGGTESYLLARGPAGENALLYLVIPRALLGTARALKPLTLAVVTARVREGRSEPVGVPILDLISLVPKDLAVARSP